MTDLLEHILGRLDISARPSRADEVFPRLSGVKMCNSIAVILSGQRYIEIDGVGRWRGNVLFLARQARWYGYEILAR